MDDRSRAPRFRYASAACAGLAALLFVAAIVLNEGALRAENGMVSDDAFGPFVLGIFLAAAVCWLDLRSAVRLTNDSAMLAAVLALAMAFVAVIGAFLVINEPAMFNSGYGCISRRPDTLLAMAARPTPATCGYLIPASDNPLFYPAAFAAFGTAALGIASAVLNTASRRSVRP